MNVPNQAMLRLALLLGLSLLAFEAAAQSEISSSGARAAQFVFIVDDSGSMKETDPDRLAVFAVQALVGMLDDRDEVSLVRLNGPRDGAPVPPIEPLRQNRKKIEDLLDLDGGLAHYEAKNTPCGSALGAVHRILQEAQRPGVSQVVMLLTDGECTPKDEEPSVDGFLRGLRSRDEGLFQFYLLGFRGKRSSPGLADLAERTGGQAVTANPGDPASILQTFAAALSRSQGYEPYLLSPQSRHLAAHRGAERVRLLAIAPGSGADLSFSVRNPRGGSPQTAGQPRTGTHRYGNGRAFRYAALDYRPDAEPVEVDVQGAGETWKVVALPEYRLTVRLAVLQGTCEQPGPATGGGAETGSTVCAVAELVNDAGEAVGGEVTGGDLTASVRVRRPDAPGTPPVEVAANQLPGGQARFGLLRSNLTRGDYELQPVVTLRLSSGDDVTLRGAPVSLVVSSLTIEPRPGNFDFGRLRPGGRAARRLTLGGSFPQTPGHAELDSRAELPSCITVELGKEPEGKAQPILVNNPYTLTLRAHPYCGPRPFSRSFNSAVRLVFGESAGGRRIPAVVLPVRFHVDYQISVPPELTVAVRGGQATDLAVPVRGNFEQEVPLRAVVAGPADAEAWPEDPENLRLGFAGERRKDLLEDGEGGALLVHDFIASPGGPPLRLRARPDRCCAGGTYRTRLGLAPAGSQPLPPGARAPEPILVPVRIDVEPAGFWACYGPRVLLGLALLLLLLLVLYIANMIRNSAFLRADTLAGKLKPLVWTEYGDAVEQKSSKNDVQLLVRRGMPLAGRALAWLRANPLRFGLPGGRYRETVELLLQPNRDVARSQVSLLAEADLQSRAERQPESYVGRLFATASGGTTFVAVPDPGGRVSRLVWQDGFAPAAPEGEVPVPKAVKLRKARLLRPLEAWESHEEGMPAGWQVG
ncbi:MAG TPA: vWA domain-containing protein [Thermoanaerobaculia bacterium]|nr:vWA domain-containing protein [Thermoanaerobaculia bacterium]